MMPSGVAERFERLRKESPQLSAYALVDGVQFWRFTGARIEPRYGANRALFVGTEDEALAHAGPWLVDLARENPSTADTLVQLEQALPSVLWLFSRLDLESLALVLQLKLNGKLPDGRVALIRFWDPRTFVGLFKALDLPSRREYYSHVDEWHGQTEGKRFHVSIHA
ncbi:conserved protein of unknown function [Paraburkholderia kururiensis]|uniref:DUF4123 domain-containing protein n=1 Tax=Paraburkholderia kururiensis TaxID=984307 RepID=UPI0039A4141B